MTCSSDLFIKIWDSQNEWKNTKTFPGHEHSVSAVRFMPGDQFIVSASRDRTIRVFDVASACVFTYIYILKFQHQLFVLKTSCKDYIWPFGMGAVRGTL